MELLAASVRSACVDVPQALLIREALQQCTVKEHPFFSDGVHLNEAGIEYIASAVDEMAVVLDADVVVSDSCLCAVTFSYEDRKGFVLDCLARVAVRPRWGASFLGGTFKQAVYRAWREFRDVRTMLVLIAGNDLRKDTDATELLRVMLPLRDYWQTGGVNLVFVDVMPIQVEEEHAVADEARSLA